MSLRDWLFGRANQPLNVEIPIRQSLRLPPRGDYRFVALDVETASSWNGSVCQIGLAVVSQDNRIAVYSTLIDPECDFDDFNTQLHGISEINVSGQPTFRHVFRLLEPLLTSYPIVQHSQFDKGAIEAACNGDDIDCPPIRWLDSVQIARRAWPELRGEGGHNLKNLKAFLNLSFRHHDAGDDARAAAEVVLAAEKHTGKTFEALAAPKPKSSNFEKNAPKVGDPSGSLAGHVVVFTGSLTMRREDAATLAAACGCDVKASVTTVTTLVVVGDQDLTVLVGHSKSSKHRKAEDLIAAGQSIRIMGEAEFTGLMRQALAGHK